MAWTQDIAAAPETREIRELATPQLYRGNAFRVLGLGVNASSTDQKRQRQLLQMKQKLGRAPSQPSACLPLDPPPDGDSINRAHQRVADPILRFLDGFFWFWPAEQTGQDRGLELLRAGKLKEARHHWTEIPAGDPRRFIAVHNLAVLYHAYVLDLERQRPLPAEAKPARDRLDELWKASHESWFRCLENHQLWTRVSELVAEIHDPRLDAGMGERLRQALPWIIVRINAALASEAAMSADRSTAERHAGYLRRNGFDPDLVGAVLDAQFESYRDVIESSCQQAVRDIEREPARGAQIGRELIAATSDRLALFDAVLSRDSHLRERCHDQVAASIRKCSVAFGNSTEQWDQCLQLISSAESIAIGEATKHLLQKDRETVLSNQGDGRAMDLVSRAANAAKSGNTEAAEQLLLDAVKSAHTPEMQAQIGSLLAAVRLGKQQHAQKQRSQLLGWGTIVGIVILASIIGAIGDCGKSRSIRGSNTPQRYTAPAPSPRARPSPSTPSAGIQLDTGLSSKIDAGKVRARSLESELGGLDDELESLSTRIRLYKNQIESYELQVRAGQRVDTIAYQAAINGHNQLVSSYNAKLQERNIKFDEYSSEIDSVNAMVRRYNSGER